MPLLDRPPFRYLRLLRIAAATLALRPAIAHATPPDAEVVPPVPPAAGEAGPTEVIDEAGVVRRTAANNPTLRAMLYELRATEWAVSAEEGRYPFTLQLDTNVMHTTSPSLNAEGVTTSNTDIVGVGAQLGKVLPWGTAVTFRVETASVVRQFPILAISAQDVTLGPGYTVSSRLAVTQPLLRSGGRRVIEAELRSARLRRDAARHAHERTQSEVLQAALGAYWELWFAAEAERIERATLELAERERLEVVRRIDLGALPPIEIYAFASRVAALEESVTLARAERQRRALELSLQLGETHAGSVALVPPASAAPPEPAELPSLRRVVDQTLSTAFQLRELQAELSLAEERERLAGEAARPRLDLTGYLQAEGLGNREPESALEQLTTLGAVSGQVGVTYELPLDDQRFRSERAQAGWIREALLQRIAALRQQLQTTAMTTRLQATAAAERIELARSTAQLSEQQRAAARDRFDAGAGLAIEIQRADDELRRARLRLARAHVDRVLAELTLAHLTGALLARHADALPAGGAPRARPPAPAAGRF